MSRVSKKITLALILLALSLFIITTSYATSMIINSESEFNEGVYYQTIYNSTSKALQLDINELSGNYTSKIFDVNESSTWNTLTWEVNHSAQEKIIIVDRTKEVFSSVNGTNWVTQTTDYGGSNSIGGMVVTLNSELILLNNKKIYFSSDQGTNWTKINNKFTPYNQKGKVMTIDSNDTLYIIDDSQRIFRSTNKGYDWTKISNDFNSANKDAKAITINSNDILFVVDANKNVYSSSNQGINWTLLTNYGGGKSIDGMTVDQNNFVYILENNKVYKSINSGLNWTKVTNDFSSYSQEGKIIFFDKQQSLIIADAKGRIFKSTNQGINWTEIGDCNSASNKKPKAGTAIYYETNITPYVRSCDSSDCLVEEFIEISSQSPQELNVSNNKYFQYKFNFATNNKIYSSVLYSVRINYTVLPDTINPAVLNLVPVENSSFNISETVIVSINATDNIAIDIVLANINLPNETIRQIILTNNTFDNFTGSFTETDLIGVYNITIIANDTSGNINNTKIKYFTISNITPEEVLDTIAPSVNNITPLAGVNFSLNSIVQLTANITDNVQVDTVFGNLTNPDLSVVLIQLFDDNGDDIYNNSIILDQPGIYYLTIIANDTSGNINNTENTYFDPAALGGGGGGGGSASSKAYKNKPTTEAIFAEINSLTSEEPACIESWICDSWSPCRNKLEVRICEDFNKCGTKKLKPITTKACKEKVIYIETKKYETPTGFVILKSSSGFGLILMGILSTIVLLGISISSIMKSNPFNNIGKKNNTIGLFKRKEKIDKIKKAYNLHKFKECKEDKAKQNIISAICELRGLERIKPAQKINKKIKKQEIISILSGVKKIKK